MVLATSLTARLPPPPELERRCVALAMLDAVICSEWEYRYFSFNRNWDPASGMRMASMRNGSGDEYFIAFFADGSAALKGFDHESPALQGQPSVRGVLDGLPASFDAFANEPAFSMDTTTFCLWNTGDGWRRSPSLTQAAIELDGSGELLALLVGTASDYVDYAKAVFEVDVSAGVIQRFFDLEPLTAELAGALRKDRDLKALGEDLDEIGYPRAAR
jgi:hypothetical protein